MYYARPPPFTYPNQMVAPSPTSTSTADTTGYFGNLSPNISDEVFIAILGCCSGFKKFKRPVDPSTGKPKPFALIEFESPGDLSRVFKLLQDFVLDNRHFNIKIESQLQGNANANANANQDVLEFEENLKCLERIEKVLIGKKLTNGGSMEWIERKIVILKEKLRENNNLKNEEKKRDFIPKDRQRNYSDLVFSDDKTRFKGHDVDDGDGKEKNKNKNNLMMNLALKDRENRWEVKVKEIERELRKDLEKDKEREKRHEKESKILFEEISKFSDSDGNYLFFTNRQKWRENRQKALEKESEIFEGIKKIETTIVNENGNGNENENNENEIQSKLKAQMIRKQKNLIEKFVPIERNELFNYPVEWEHLIGCAENFKNICNERICSFFGNGTLTGDRKRCCLKLSEIIYDRISNGHVEPMKLINELSLEPSYLGVSSESGEAELLVMIIWRWLIYCTTAQFYNVELCSF